MTHIEPTLPGGFKDYLPSDMIPRQGMLDAIRGTFELFGFSPVDTSGVQRTEVLTGGDSNFKKQIYDIVSKGGEEGELSLRFDLTVPLARLVGSHMSDLKRPFKRYEIGKVWRGERQQAGRYREFAQCDADIVGAHDISADADVITTMYAVMIGLGFKNFQIKINNRKILNGLSELAGFDSSKLESVLRSIDKLDKSSWEDVKKELMSAEGAHLSLNQTEHIHSFVGIKSTSPERSLAKISELMKGIAVAEEGVNELRQLSGYLQLLGVKDEHWVIDFSIARGLGYYTGVIFETELTDLPSIGSVISGGRYDGLIGMFGQIPIPAVGASVGIDRLFAAMEQLNLIPHHRTVTDVLFLNFDEAGKKDVLKGVSELRSHGIKSEFYVGHESNLKGQLAYAVATEVPFVIIIGATETGNGTAVIKDMKKRTQKEIKQKHLVEELQELMK